MQTPVDLEHLVILLVASLALALITVIIGYIKWKSHQ
jgi:hypothetical protein